MLSDAMRLTYYFSEEQKQTAQFYAKQFCRCFLIESVLIISSIWIAPSQSCPRGDVYEPRKLPFSTLEHAHRK